MATGRFQVTSAVLAAALAALASPLPAHHDDFPDVVVTDLDSLWVFPGDGAGGFRAPLPLFIETGVEPWGLATGDVDGDGDIDIVSANRLGNHVSIHLGDGAGGFAPPRIISTNQQPYDVDLADLDGDGDLDLAIPCNYDPGTLEVRFNDGAGGFSRVDLHFPGREPFNAEFADFDGDGIPDLATTLNADDALAICINNGDGSMRIESIVPAGNDPKAIKSGFFDGDAHVDLAITNYDDGQISIFLGDGTGKFTRKAGYPAGVNPREIVVVDLDGDRNRDLVVAGGRSTDFVARFLGNGDGTFRGPVNFTTGPRPNSLDAGDFNRDGRPDVVVANWSLDAPALATLSLLAGRGDGGFSGKTDFRPPGGFRKFTALAIGQFNAWRFRRGDADLDGAINITDPIVALRFLFAGSELRCHDAADADDSGAVDVTDPVIVLEWLFLDGPPLPPPFRAPGFDPTSDRLPCDPE